MIKRQETFNLLVLLSLATFGSFGSLSHLFNLGLIIFLLSSQSEVDRYRNDFKFNLFLTCVLSAVFFISFFRSLFTHSLNEVFFASSPMLSIPILSALILLSKSNNFSFSLDQIAKYSQISIIIGIMVYFILAMSPDHIRNDFADSKELSLFSGNPIPFSTVFLGLAFFSLASWHNLGKYEKIKISICFLCGIYFAIFLSGSRGAFVALLLCLPFIIWHLSRSRVLSILVFTASLLILAISITLFEFKVFYHPMIEGLIASFKTIIWGGVEGKTDTLRVEMWKASFIAISEKPFIGYGISERIEAIKHYLPASFNYRFSHPHNDIMAISISTGVFGGLLAFFALLSPFWASFRRLNNCKEATYLGIVISITTFITAMFNTIFFNDITAAWLVFSTFLILNIRPKLI